MAHSAFLIDPSAKPRRTQLILQFRLAAHATTRPVALTDAAPTSEPPLSVESHRSHPRGTRVVLAVRRLRSNQVAIKSQSGRNQVAIGSQSGGNQVAIR